MPQRLPTPGGDNGDWGDILNAFLEVSHNSDGTLANNVVGTNQIQTASVTASQISLGAIGTDQLADGSVTNSKLDTPTQTAISNASSALSESTADSRYIQQSQLGAASGVAQLDSNSTLEASQLPSSVVTATGAVTAGHLPKFNGTGNETQDSGLALSSVVTATTKRVTYPLGGDGSDEYTGYGDWIARTLFKLPVTPTRFRVRVIHYDYLTDTNPGGTWNFAGVYVGPALMPNASPDRWTGVFASAPTEVMAAETTNDGTDYVGSWIYPSTFELQAGVLYGVSWGANGTNSQTSHMATAGALHYWNSTGTTISGQVGASTTPSGITGGTDNWHPWDIRIEYEYLTADGLVGLFVGDSITNGSIDYGLSASKGAFSYQMWPGAAALRNGFSAINIGISGSTSGNWAVATTDPRYSRVDLTTTVPDFAVVSLGSNDANSSIALATYQANIRTIIENLRALGINRIYLGTITPRFMASYDAGGETFRTSYNAWIRTLPEGVDGIFDFDKVIALPPVTLTTTATLTAGAGGNPITVASATGIAVGQAVLAVSPSTGALSNAGATTVTAVSGTSITLSQNPQTSGSATLQFSNDNPVPDPEMIAVIPHPTLAGYQRMASVVAVG